MQLFHTIFYQPIFNLLIWLYNVIPGTDIGLAIVVLTILAKILLFPFSLQSMRSQRRLQELQPKLAELKEKHKGDKEAVAKATMALYSREKVNPFASCLPLLIQLPVLFALYRALSDGLTSSGLSALYTFVGNPGHIDSSFLGLIDLARPSVPIALIAGAAQFWQSKMMSTVSPPKKVAQSSSGKDEATMAALNKQMLYLMPIFTVVIGSGLPGGLALYWLITNILTVAQQYYVFYDHERKTRAI